MIAKIALAITVALASFSPMPVMSDSTKKPYMDYRTITDYTSPQYQIVSQAQHEPDGTLTVDGYTCVALGQNYGAVGDRFVVQIGGETYRIVMADAKRFCDTAGGAGWTGVDGHQIELVVDTGALPQECRILGDCDSIMPGSVEAITRIDTNSEDDSNASNDL